MNDTAFARDALEALVPPFRAERGDWDDVLRRAGSDEARARVRRRHRPVLIAAVLLALVGSAFGAERMIGLFSDEGTAVDIGDLSEDDRQVLRISGRGVPVRSIEQIGSDGERAYYKVEFENGIGCLFAGTANASNRFGSGSCGRGLFAATDDHPLLPSRKRPITADVYAGASVDDPEERIWRVTGLAGEGVARVGLVDSKGDVYAVPVKGRVYTLADLPRRNWVALIALDDEGNELYRERLPPREGPVRRARSDRDSGEPGGAGERDR